MTKTVAEQVLDVLQEAGVGSAVDGSAVDASAVYRVT